MKFVFSKKYLMDLEGHIFPVEKYELLRRKLLQDLGDESYFVEPERPSLEDLMLVHEKEYLEDFINLRWTWRTLMSEAPLNPTVVEGFIYMAGGSHRAASIALEEGWSMNIGGGFHHAYPDHAEGFCYINDIAYAVKKLKAAGKIKKALIVDCDLHQGNGTAFIFRGDPDVFTFSIHQELLYPYPKEPGDLDIGLDAGVGDEEYLEKLREGLEIAFRRIEPEIIIYQAGADPYRGDPLGQLRLSKEGLRKRDELVYSYAAERSIPVAITLGGGYTNPLDEVVEIHHNTALAAMEILGR